MGWFQRLFGGTSPSPPPPPPAPSPAGPLVVDLVPRKLVARVFTHDFAVGSDKLPCWTYVTQGFAPIGQKEFVFTLVRERGADPAKPPSDPLQFFTQVYSLAEQKQFVDTGGFTCFQPRAGGFLGLTGMVGFAYTRPEAIPGIEMPSADECLSAIFLLPGEAELVQAGWGYRVLVRLGRANHYYPHPPWSDPRRAAVLAPDEAQVSVLGKMPNAYLNGASVRMFLRPTTVPEAGAVGQGGPLGERVTLRIRRERLEQVRDLLARLAPAEGGAFAFTFGADPDANVRLAWQPGDTTTNTITPAAGDASCLTGGFLALVFGAGITESGRVVEDGFAMTLGAESWARLRDALNHGEPLALPAGAPGEIALSVEWLGGPAGETGASEPPGAAFRIDSMMLYQPDEVLKVRMPSAAAVAEFVKQVEAVAAAFWSGQPAGKPQPVLVVTAFKPGGRVRVWVDVPAGAGAEPAARECAARLERLSPPVVQHGSVAIAIRASLWGGSGEWPFIPKEWQEAAVAAGGSVLVPDGILERLWSD
jgi:hypothetical protein